MGNYLRSDAPDSMRNWAILWGRETIWKGWGRLADAVKTGEIAPKLIAGMGTFEWIAQDEEGAAIFNRSMLELTRRVSRAVVAAYDFSGIGRIVDVGGGYGALLPAILAKHPDMRGVVFDLPYCRGGALRFFEEAEVSGRWTSWRAAFSTPCQKAGTPTSSRASSTTGTMSAAWPSLADAGARWVKARGCSSSR